MGDIRRVLVVGGGVGGLTAAATFARRGVEVVLIERRPTFDIPGVGLGQPANALRVYDSLGVLDEILATGFSYDRMWLFDPDRRLIVEHKFLLGELWDNLTDAQYLRVYVRQLRQKIEADPERPQYVLTETGIGYRLKAGD